MARRARALKTIAAPASLALALSLPLALAAFSPAAADPPNRPSAVEEPAAEGAGERTAAELRAERQAERAARHSERVAARNETAPPPAASPTATAPAGGAAGGTGSSSKATRRAEHAEQRAARRSAKDTTPTRTGAGTRTAAASQPAAAKSKGNGSEQEREEKRRQREERRQRTGHETRKEKLARAEREAQEAANRQPSSGATALASGTAATAASAAGLAPASTPESRAAALAPSGPPAIAGEHGVRSTAARRAAAAARARKARRGAGASGLTGLPAVGGVAGGHAAVVPSTAGAGASSHGHKARHRSGGQPSSSPLVTTVTRIIGVIPAALWLLIGVLALAAVGFAATSRVVARRARRLERQRRALLEDVGLLQAALLPELPGRLGAVSTTAAYRPASGPGAGGDFYDVFALPEGLVAVIVGDVSGHGREALPHTTLLRYTLRAYLEAGLTPRESLRAAAPALERQLGGSFATVVLATYDPRERLLTYSCAGHPHPLLTGLDPDAANIACAAPPIGTGRPTGTRQTVVSVPGAALAAFYTDGVIEARTDGELYGQRRLGGALEAVEGADGEAAARLLDIVREQTDGRPDDMAACVLGIAGGEGRPRIISEELELDAREARRARRFLLKAGVDEQQAEQALERAQAIAHEHGSVLIALEMAGGTPEVSLTHDNVAPLRARALARTQEVAL
jgi:serine phosphatase RsbU (regulator of sigma subunit)